MAPDRKRRGGLPDTGPQGAPGEQLDHAILRSEPAFNALEVAAETGVTIEQTRRLWRALGFPEFTGEKAYTAADIKAVSTLMGFVDSGAVDFDTAVNLTRGVGQTMARLADWEVSTLVSRVEEMEAGEEATGSRIGSALRLIDEVNPPFERLLVYAWRRHLAAAVGRIEAMGAKDEDLHTIDVSVGFADLVSFTALSNTLDRDEIGDLVEVFESRCQDVVARYGGRIIKSLGDSVLFVTNTAEEAVGRRRGDHQRHRARPEDARRPSRPRERSGRPAPRRHLRPAGQHGRTADAGRPAQPADRGPEHRRPAPRRGVGGPAAARPPGARLRPRGARGRTPPLTQPHASLEVDQTSSPQFTHKDHLGGGRSLRFTACWLCRTYDSTPPRDRCGVATARSGSPARSSSSCTP